MLPPAWLDEWGDLVFTLIQLVISVIVLKAVWPLLRRRGPWGK